MTALELHQNNVGGVEIDQVAILKALKLDPRDPNTQALLLVCDRYNLDPLLKHMVLIQGTPYVTRDGYLAIAHRSGQFDGMEVKDQSSDQTHYYATVSVWRKDMGRPFTFTGRFPKSKSMAKDFGPEMAVKVAEVQALRRAFNVTGVSAADERWDVPAGEILAADQADNPLPVTVPHGPVAAAVAELETGETSPPTRRKAPPTKVAEISAEYRQTLKDALSALADSQRDKVKEMAKGKLPNIDRAEFSEAHGDYLSDLITTVKELDVAMDTAKAATGQGGLDGGEPFL